MKRLYWAYALTSLLFGVAVMLFFASLYPHHLHFQEQCQLFLFAWSYVGEVLPLPGGLADLIGRFFTQFFLYAWVGASIIALLLMLVQWLTYRLLQPSGVEPLTYVLSFVPAMLCCVFLCDENALMSAPVALLVILCMALSVQCVTSDRLRLVIGLVSIPVTYLLAGAFALPYALLLVIRELQRGLSFRVGVFVSIQVVVALATPAAWAHFVHFPMQSLYWGLHYYRMPGVFAHWAWAAASIVPLLRLLPRKLRCWAPRRTLAVVLSFWLLLMMAGGMMVSSLYSQAQEDTMAYDFMARNAMWNRILQYADHHAPRNQVSTVALNLALAERGTMCDRMFDYPQNGLAGLLPNFDTDCVSPLATSEAFYRLGMINTAQRFVFEAQEAIPDHQKSARCYKRLAETNLINGAYAVARKYLEVLQQTLFYRHWAEQTLALIADDAAVEVHSEYGALRSMRCCEDYYFGGNELHQILLRQLQSNPHNRIAFEYLEAACMLAKDVDLVTLYYPMSEPLGFASIPIAIQQAMLLDWSQHHDITESLPDYFHPSLLQGLKNFYSAMQMHRSNPAPMQRTFGQTYWFYYYFR